MSNPFDDDINPEPSVTSAQQHDKQSNLMDNNEDDEDANAYHYLGDIPYCRVHLYDEVDWSTPDPSDTETNHNQSSGLSNISPSLLEKLKSMSMSAGMSVDDLKSTTTVTKFAACPFGGPIACVTLPLPSIQMGRSTTSRGGSGVNAIIRILSSSGRFLSSIVFPPVLVPSSGKRMEQTTSSYAPEDIHTIGFTSRWNFLVILRDGFCFSYDLRGNLIIPPFPTIVQIEKYGPVELVEADIFDGGVAVLSTTMHSALVEILDEHDDPLYVEGRHLSSRIVNGYGTSLGQDSLSRESKGNDFSCPPPYFALVTPLPTSSYASLHSCRYCTLGVLSRLHTESRRPEAFLSTADNSIVIVDSVSLKIVDVDCRARISSPVISMSFAPNGRFISCFLQDGTLTVISTAFDTKVLDFDTSGVSSSPPKEMKWCGEDSIVLHWKNLGVLMVGPFGDWLRFSYENISNLFLVPEIDCCRVFTDNCVDILLRVHPSTADLFRIGSIEPSSLLLDASDAFESGSSSADESARAITRTGLLTDAIEACTDAAIKEFDVLNQKRLLRAASYGMHFSFRTILTLEDETQSEEKHDSSPSQSALKFVASAKKLRVLNALRDKDIGFALTSHQYDMLPSSGLIARLVAMKCPTLATSLCSYLNLDRTAVAFAQASRASAVIAASGNLSDAEAADAAIKILNEDLGSEKSINSGTSKGRFASVALSAFRVGRSGVANRLLKLEMNATDKVPALTAIGNYTEAAQCSVKAWDNDLLFLTLMEFEKSSLSEGRDIERGRQKFVQSIITTFPKEALDLLRCFYSCMDDSSRLRDLLIRSQRFVNAGELVAQKALHASNQRDTLSMLQDASQIFSLGKDNTLFKSCTDDYIELLRDQERLREAFSPQIAPKSSSITDTLMSMIRYVANDESKLASLIFREVDVLAKKYRVSDKRLWHIKIQSLASSGQWRFLHNLAERKSPIGYKAFAIAAIEGRQPIGEIVRYIEKVTSIETRYDLYCQAKFWKRALQEAAKLDDMRRMEYVKSQM